MSKTESERKQAAISRTGRRSNNQDRSVTRKWEGDPPRLLAAVADGMGGGFAGGEAAQIAVDTLVEELENPGHPAWGDDDDAAGESLKTLAVSAHQRIEEKAEDIASGGLMGTTLTAALLQGGRLRILHIGDTRLYLVQEDKLNQLTRDHRPDPELGIPDNVITRCLGCKQSEVEISQNDVPENSVVLVCSDGFFGPLRHEDIMERISGRPGLTESITDLATMAYNRGSDDNMSAAAIETGRFPRSEEMLAPVEESEKEDTHPTDDVPASPLPLWLVTATGIIAMFAFFLFLLSLTMVPQKKEKPPDKTPQKDAPTVRIVPPPPGPALRVSQVDVTEYPPWIRAYFVVLGEQGELIKNVIKEDITIREDDLVVSDWELKPVYAEDNSLGLVMAIDVSGSMINEPVAQARKAGINLVRTMKPKDVLTLLAFGESVSVVLDGESASQREKIQRKFSSLDATPKAKTSLYKAVSTGVSLLGKMNTRQKALVVLSDGKDTVSPEEKRMETLRVSRTSGYPVYTVGLYNNSLDRKYLQKLAEESKGRYLEAPEPAQLIKCFDILARELTKGYIAEHRIIGDKMQATKRLHMEFSRPGLSLSAHRIYSTSYDVGKKPPPPSPPPVEEGPDYLRAVLLMLVGGLFGSIIALALMIVAAGQKKLRRSAPAYILFTAFVAGAFLTGALLRFAGLLL